MKQHLHQDESIDADEQTKKLQELVRQKNGKIHELKEYVQELKDTNSEGSTFAVMEGRISRAEKKPNIWAS